MAIMMILIYGRYSHFRLSSASAIKALQKKTDEQSSALRIAYEKLVVETKTDNQKIQALLLEVDELRKEKENEIKLRLSAEKQIDLTLQKMQDLERRMEDWKIMQDAVMRDSKEAIVKVGNDLYKKLNDSYKQEVETSKNLLGRISKTVTDFFDNFSATSKTPIPKVVANNSPKPELQPEIHVEDSSKQLVSGLVDTMKANGYLSNKDYFLPANFDEHKAKLMLCELAFVGKDILHIIDFKSCHYLAEFDQLRGSNKVVAENYLKQKMDRYFAYLNDPKYRNSISHVMSVTKAKFGKTIIILALPSKAELQTLKEIHYFDKAQRFGFQVMDIDGVNNVIL